MKTLNQMLGSTYHISPLRRKIIRLGITDPKEWQTLAIQRGCNHYSVVSDPVEDPGLSILCNEELGLALLLGELSYDPQAIRVAAQLLSGEINLEKILRIAKLERLEPLLHRLAKDILSFGIEHKNWKEILDATSAKTSRRAFFLIQPGMLWIKVIMCPKVNATIYSLLKVCLNFA